MTSPFILPPDLYDPPTNISLHLYTSTLIFVRHFAAHWFGSRSRLGRFDRASQDDLQRVLTLHSKRRLTSNLTLHHNRVLYVADASARGVDDARGKLVDVRELENGDEVIEHNGKVDASGNLSQYPK
jgi:hypothetical protein